MATHLEPAERRVHHSLLIDYQTSLAMELRWRALPAGSAMIMNIKQKKIKIEPRIKLNYNIATMHRALATRQFSKKIESPSQAKIRSCSRGLSWIQVMSGFF